MTRRAGGACIPCTSAENPIAARAARRAGREARRHWPGECLSVLEVGIEGPGAGLNSSPAWGAEELQGMSLSFAFSRDTRHSRRVHCTRRDDTPDRDIRRWSPTWDCVAGEIQATTGKPGKRVKAIAPGADNRRASFSDHAVCPGSTSKGVLISR